MAHKPHSKCFLLSFFMRKSMAEVTGRHGMQVRPDKKLILLKLSIEKFYLDTFKKSEAFLFRTHTKFQWIKQA